MDEPKTLTELLTPDDMTRAFGPLGLSGALMASDGSLRSLNRGTSEQGKVWKEMERQIIEHPGTPLFVRPLYDDGTWVPTLIEYGVLTDEQLWRERFENRARRRRANDQGGRSDQW